MKNLPNNYLKYLNPIETFVFFKKHTNTSYIYYLECIIFLEQEKESLGYIEKTLRQKRILVEMKVLHILHKYLLSLVLLVEKEIQCALEMGLKMKLTES
jgi:hypothetical protein